MELHVELLCPPPSKQGLHPVMENGDEHLKRFSHDLPIAVCQFSQIQFLQLFPENELGNAQEHLINVQPQLHLGVNKDDGAHLLDSRVRSTQQHGYIRRIVQDPF
jgi:hypothetical protein